MREFWPYVLLGVLSAVAYVTGGLYLLRKWEGR